MTDVSIIRYLEHIYPTLRGLVYVETQRKHEVQFAILNALIAFVARFKGRLSLWDSFFAYDFGNHSVLYLSCGF